MKHLLILVFILGPLALEPAHGYEITILSPSNAINAMLRGHYGGIVGKGISDIFGPVSEIRITHPVLGKGPDDDEKLKENIRSRIDRAKCLGQESDVPWSKAIWISGHILFMDGRILPIKIMLSGIIVEHLLFED